MTCLGNISLLDQPAVGFLCSRCTRSSAILPSLDWAVAHCKGKEPIISTFHSAMEDAVLDMLIAGTCPIILVLGRSLYKQVPEKLQPLLDSNRLLIVSLSEQKRITRESAFECNKYICTHSESLAFGFLAPDSSLYPLYEEAKRTHSSGSVICLNEL